MTVCMDERIESYEGMIYKWIHKLNILVDVDDFVQVGRLAVYEGVCKFDGMEFSGARGAEVPVVSGVPVVSRVPVASGVPVVSEDTDQVNDAGMSEASLVYGIIRNRLIDEIRRRSRFNVEVVVDDDVLVDWSGFVDETNYFGEWMIVAESVLSDVEFACFKLLLMGFTQMEIAARIGKSRSTVKMYRKNIQEKLRVFL